MSGNLEAPAYLPRSAGAPDESAPLDSQMLCLAPQCIIGSQTVLIFWGVFALLFPGIQECKLTEEFLHIVNSWLSYFKKSSLQFLYNKIHSTPKL